MCAIDWLFSEKKEEDTIYARTLLLDSEVEAVAAFTDPAGRAELLRKIIRSGKDVMTTKSFEADPEAARSVLSEAIELNRMIHLNSPSAETPPDIACILSWQSRFSLGRPVACHIQTYCSYRELPDGTWYEDPQKCPAAPFYRLGIYGLNDILYFFANPVQITLLQSKLFTIDLLQIKLR